jgi:signal transduction histidine kinase/ligand-binding sensor domain-containing protein
LVALFILLFAFVPPAFGQVRFETWTTESGLPQNSVMDIVQTRDGYLWLATLGGLVRFDGVRFVVFDSSEEGIKSQRVRALHEDRKGRLWAATEDGMLIVYSSGRFETHAILSGVPDAMGLTIDEDDSDTLWITWSGAVTKFDGKRFVNYLPGDFEHEVRPSNPVTLAAGSRWWSQDSTGVHVLIAGRVRTFSLTVAPEVAVVTAVNSDRHSNVWMLTTGAGAFRSRNGHVEQFTVENGLPTNRLSGRMRADRRGAIWYSNDAAFQAYRVHANEREQLDLPGIQTLYEDREGFIWLGTNTGLFRVRDSMVTMLSERDGLSANFAYSILQDKRGVFWIGTWGGGLNRYHHGKFTTYRQTDGLPSDLITSIYEDKAGRLWIGTSAGGVSTFENGGFTRFLDAEQHLTGRVYGMHEDQTGALWFATDRGLVRMSGGRTFRFTTQDGLSADELLSLLEDRDGALWIGGFQGLTRLKNGVFTRYTERDGFIGRQVRALYEDAERILWIGTYDGGLYRLAQGRLTRYTRKDGLHDNGVFQILEDSGGYLWMGSNRGISRISRRELNNFAEGRIAALAPMVLDRRDGLATGEINGGRHPPGWKADNGALWFPTLGGVAIIDPKLFDVDAVSLSVVVEEFRVDGVPVDFLGGVTIPQGALTFEARYTVPRFRRPDQAKFRYRLVGLDEHWVYAGERRAASFHRLPPGHYRFVVSAADYDGAWDGETQAVNITIVPPFWRQWWFVSLTVAILIASITIGHQRRVQGLHRRNAQQEEFAKQLIESQEHERQRISSEVHDSLGQELAIIKLRARAAASREANGEAADFAAIAASAEKMDAEMKAIAQGLHPYLLDKIGLRRTIEAMIRRVSAECQIDMTVDIEELDDLVAEHHRIHVFRIVQEAVSNVVRHSGAHRATITIARRDGTVEIAVQDDGPMLTSTARDLSEGFGLRGMRARARILGGSIHIQSGSHIGTMVVARFPATGGTHG